MSEIGGTNFNVGQTNFKGVQKSQLEPAVNNDTDGEATPQVTDFSNNKAEALGRSMLFKGVDDINHDLKVLLDNPQIAENSDEIFETAYKVAVDNGIENPYEEAASASTTAI